MTSLLIVVSSLALPVPAQAHPHVFVEPTLTLVFDEQGLAGFRQVWVFDEMFSILILEDHDRNGDRNLDPGEVASIKAGAFDNIKAWGFFTHVAIDGKPFPVKWVTDFTARVEAGHLVYEFFIPCHVAASDRPKKVTLSVFDPDYYVDFSPPLQEEVGMEGSDVFAVSLDVSLDPGAVFSEWMITPTVSHIVFSRS